MKKLIFPALALLVIAAAGCKKNDEPEPSCSFTTIFTDDFGRADSPYGSAYLDTVVSRPAGDGFGFADLYGNQLRVSSTYCYWAVWYATAVKDDIIRVSVTCSIPETGGESNFGIGGRFTLPGQTMQSGYFGAAMNGGIGIYRTENINSVSLASAAFELVAGHTCRAVLTIDNANLTFTVTDNNTGKSATVTGHDSTPLTGQYCTINGNTLAGEGVIYFDDYLVEKCK